MLRILLLLPLLAFSQPFKSKAFGKVVTHFLSTGSNFGTIKASVTYEESLEDKDKGLNIILFNPGANVAPENMQVFSRSSAKAGFLVIMVKNAWNLPVLPNNQKNPFKIVELVRVNHSIFAPLPESLREKLADSRLLVVGHSLGAAVLSKATTTDQSRVDGFVFLGASKLLSHKTVFESETIFMFGSLDGLVKKDVVERVALEMGSEVVVLDEVNHFCIIDETSVGNPIIRRFDNPTRKSVADCNKTLVASIIKDTISWH